MLSHIVGGLNRVAIVGEGGDALARPARADDVPDDGWAAAYRAAAARAQAAWADDAKLDAMVRSALGQGPRPVRDRRRRAGNPDARLGPGQGRRQPTEGDPELAQWALAGAQRVLPPDSGGGDIPFGPVVEVPADAAPYAQLAAFLGRHP